MSNEITEVAILTKSLKNGVPTEFFKVSKRKKNLESFVDQLKASRKTFTIVKNNVKNLYKFEGKNYIVKQLSSK